MYYYAFPCSLGQECSRFLHRKLRMFVIRIEPLHSVHAKPLIADLVVDSKLGRISHTFHFTMKEINALQGDLENVRKSALFKAVNEVYHCDVIVAASFDVKSTDEGYDVTIIGFVLQLAYGHQGGL